MSSYTPKPSTVYVDNIYDMKSWHGYAHTSLPSNIMEPHTFFVLQEMEKVRWKWYTIFWLVESARNGYPRKNHLSYVMKDMPLGYPSLLRPKNTKNATPETMERAVDHLKTRLTGADTEWWTLFVASREREKREMWEEMIDEEYSEAEESFDICSLSFKPLFPDQDDKDEDILRAEAAILQQLNKEHRSVRYM